MKKLRLFTVLALLTGFGVSFMSCSFDVSSDKLRKNLIVNGNTTTLYKENGTSTFKSAVMPINQLTGTYFCIPGEELEFTFDFCALEDIENLQVRVYNNLNGSEIDLIPIVEVASSLSKYGVIHYESTVQIPDDESYFYRTTLSPTTYISIEGTSDSSSSSLELKSFVNCNIKNELWETKKLNWNTNFDPETGNYSYMNYTYQVPLKETGELTQLLEVGDTINLYCYFMTESNFGEISCNVVSNAEEDSWWKQISGGWNRILDYNSNINPSGYIGTNVLNYTISETYGTSNIDRLVYELACGLYEGETGYIHPDGKYVKIYMKSFVTHN